MKTILIARLVIILLLAGCASCALLMPEAEVKEAEIQEEALRTGNNFTVDGIEYTINKIGYGASSDNHLYIEYTAKKMFQTKPGRVITFPPPYTAPTEEA